MLVNSLKIKIITLFVIGILIFIGFQLKNYYFRENIVLFDFKNINTVTVDAQKFYLEGSTNSIKKLFVNNKEYLLDENNDFNIELFLFSGYNEFGVKGITKTNSEINKKIIIFNAQE